MIEIEVRAPNRTWRLLFSGDVGRYDAPLYHDPKAPVDCDFLVCESTYGNREHSNLDILDELERVVTDSIRRGGVMLVSSFAVGRAQQLIYLLRVLMSQDRIPMLPVYLDSPMAVNATEIYCNHAEDHDLSETASESKGCELYGPNIHLSRTVAESKRINDVEGPAVIISSSGMMTGGRILFHLKRRLPEAKNSIVLGGFMARGTRARALQEGATTLRIHGRDIPVRAHVESLSALSGHAGRSELLRWLALLKPPKLTFLTHGEPDGSESLAKTLREDREWKVEIPELGDTFDLENL